MVKLHLSSKIFSYNSIHHQTSPIRINKPPVTFQAAETEQTGNHVTGKERVLKKIATYLHFVDKRLTPLPPYPRRTKLIIFTLRNLLSTFANPTPTLGPYPLSLKAIILFFNFYLFIYLERKEKKVLLDLG